MPVTLRNADGQTMVVDAADVAYYTARGWQIETPEDRLSAAEQAAATPDDRGLLGDINAGATGLLSGLTLGGSDVAIGSLATDTERARLREDRAASPVTSTLSQIAGSVAPALVAPTSLLAKTPAGIVGQAAARGYEAGKVLGGASGLATAAAATGAEGAIQGAGAYLSDVALGDRELSAEGMAGALGAGFAFGAAGGGAFYGIERGTMAARRMFSAPPGGAKAAEAATQEWKDQSQRVFEANDRAAELAVARLAELRAARESADLARQQAGAALADARAGRLPPVEVKLEEAIAEYGAAKADLDDLLSRLEAPTIEPGVVPAPTQVPIGEFGAPGAPGRSPPRLPEPGPPSVAEAATGDVTAFIKRKLADGTPVGTAAPSQVAQDTAGASGRGLTAAPSAVSANVDDSLEALLAGTKQKLDAGDEFRGIGKASAPDASTVPVQRLDRYQAAKASAAVQSELGPKIQQEIDEFLPYANKHRASLRKCANGLCDTLEPEFRNLVGGKSHRFDLVSDEGIAEVKRLYHMTDDQVASMVRSNNGRMKRLDIPKEDMFHQVTVMPDGVVIDWTANQFNKLPVPYVFRLHPKSAGEPTDTLTGLLRGTKDRLDAGEGFRDIGAPARADYAAGKAAKQEADAAFFRNQAAKLPVAADAPRSIVHDVADIAPIATRYEQAAAAVTEAVEDVAPQIARDAAKAVREAESAADSKMLDRAARAIDDSVDAPAPMTGKRKRQPEPDAVAEARARKLNAEADFARARVAESEARLGAAAAKKTAKDARDAADLAADTISPGKAPAKASKVAIAGDVGAALEVADVLDIPGLPRPRDIPIVGPLLSAYLKYRAVKAAAGRFTGRVEATGNARAAALAAATKSKIALAVDKSLGLVEAAAPKAPPVVSTAAARMPRAFDDGEPDVSEDASLPEVAAARIREVSAAAANPQAVVAQVRREMRDVHDPDLIAAVEKHRLRAFEYLASVAPKAPPPNPYTKREWRPNPADSVRFGRQYEAAFDPAAVFELLAQRSLSLEAAETLRATSPKLFQMAQTQMADRAGDIENPVPYAQRLQNSRLFDVAMDPSLEPESLAILQIKPQRAPSTATPQPGQPPIPSIADSTNLTNMYQTDFDRRAMR